MFYAFIVAGEGVGVKPSDCVCGHMGVCLGLAMGGCIVCACLYKMPFVLGWHMVGVVSTIRGCDARHRWWGWGVLRVFAVFVYLIRVFSGLLPGWPQPEC